MALLEKIKRSWPKFQVDVETHRDWESGLRRFTDDDIWFAVTQINSIHKYESPPRLGVVVEFLNEQRPVGINGEVKSISVEDRKIWKNAKGYECIWFPGMRDKNGDKIPPPTEEEMNVYEAPQRKKTKGDVQRIFEEAKKHMTTIPEGD